MNHQFNPEMLILGREMRGITQTQLSQITNIPQGNISMYESGVRAVNPTHLEKISQALEFPTAFFFREGKIKAVEGSSVFHRKRQSISKSVLAKLDAMVNLLRLDLEKLLKTVDVDFPLKFPQYRLEDYNDDIETIAAMVRATWDIPSGPVRSLVDHVEASGCVLLMVNFETDKMDANAQWKQPSPPVALLSNSISGERQRFSLAHELGHLVMHRDSAPYAEMEEEADQFASALLMSADRFCIEAPPITIEHLLQIKSSWKVSVQALIRRARDLDLISERRYTSLLQTLSRNGYRTVEPFPLPAEKPKFLNELFRHYLEDLSYSEKDIADTLAIYEHDLRSRYTQRLGASHLTLMPKVKPEKKKQHSPIDKTNGSN